MIHSLICSLVHAFILNSFLKYLLSISYVPGTMLDTEITRIIGEDKK